MNLCEYNTIRKEFLNFPTNGIEFHILDPDFLPDSNYRSINILESFEYFPETIRIIHTLHKNAHQCFFAIIDGPKFVAPHKNKDKHNNSLRTHYGIIVHPQDDGVLNVGKMRYLWKQNETFTFDTKQLHSVYKSKNYKRVVLIVDNST